MNRRELLKRGFELGAAGLLLPMVEPIRRYWSLDRTMVPSGATFTYRFDASPPPLGVWLEDTIAVDDASIFVVGSPILVGDEPMYLTGISGNDLSVLRWGHKAYAAR